MHPWLELMNNFIGGWKKEELFELTREKIVRKVQVVRVNRSAPLIPMQLAEQLIEWLMKGTLLFLYFHFPIISGKLLKIIYAYCEKSGIPIKYKNQLET